MTQSHTPVLAGELIDLLDPRPGEVAVDCTFGGGGHARLLAERIGPAGMLIGVDRDPVAEERFADLSAEVPCETRFIRADYVRALEQLGEEGVQADLAYFDLGMSSMQVDTWTRGFSYAYDAPLDMRMDPAQTLTAKTIVNTWDERQLTRLFRDYGEERYAPQIARSIARARRREALVSTHQLVNAIKAAVPVPAQFAGGHPARRTFQALRIAVNDELAQLDAALPIAWTLLRDGRTVGGDLVPFARGSPRQALPRRASTRLRMPARASHLRLRPRCPGGVADAPRGRPDGRRGGSKPKVKGGAPARRAQAGGRPEMTPTASTPAAGGSATERSAHRRRLRPRPGARPPRRVSGPVGGRGADAAAGRSTVPDSGRSTVPDSGRSTIRDPGRRRAPAGRSAPRSGPSLGARAVTFVLALPDHPLLDRLVRARAWIPVLGVLLAGIVAMQVEVLKLGASIGRSVQTTTELQSRNELLRASVANLSNEQRIESMAETMGMVMPAPDGVSFLVAQRDGDAARAAVNIHAPSPSTFSASPVAGSESATSTATANATADSTATAVGCRVLERGLRACCDPARPSHRDAVDRVRRAARDRAAQGGVSRVDQVGQVAARCGRPAGDPRNGPGCARHDH